MAGYQITVTAPKRQPTRAETPPVGEIPDLAEHKRRPPRTHSFGNDEEARLAAKRETNAAYRERNRERVLARHRAWYAKNRKNS